jgi:hypothetical protein
MIVTAMVSHRPWRQIFCSDRPGIPTVLLNLRIIVPPGRLIAHLERHA